MYSKALEQCEQQTLRQTNSSEIGTNASLKAEDEAELVGANGDGMIVALFLGREVILI
jgi:hypothetical protein